MTFSISMDVLVYKDAATGKYVAIGANFQGNRLVRCVEMVDDPKEATTYLEAREINRLPVETQELLKPFTLTSVRVTLSR